MASSQRASSSGSDCDPRNGNATIDEKKRKRMESNRESARRSRMRKRKQLDDLTGQVSQLQNANSQLFQDIDVNNQKFVEVESSNNVLRAQLMGLTERLRFLNSILEMLELVSGCAIDIPEIPDSLMNPWQLPYPSRPIVASAETLRY